MHAVSGIRMEVFEARKSLAAWETGARNGTVRRDWCTRGPLWVEMREMRADEEGPLSWKVQAAGIQIWSTRGPHASRAALVFDLGGARTMIQGYRSRGNGSTVD